MTSSITVNDICVSLKGNMQQQQQQQQQQQKQEQQQRCNKKSKANNISFVKPERTFAEPILLVLKTYRTQLLHLLLICFNFKSLFE